jgi:hypothetical protein
VGKEKGGKREVEIKSMMGEEYGKFQQVIYFNGF